MLVAFTTQVMASSAMSYAAISCAHKSMSADMPMMTNGYVANEMPNKVMGQTSMMLSDNNQEKMDCCQEQCHCPMSGCVSLSFLFNTHFNTEVIVEQKIAQLSSLHQSQVNSSLYRPPIS